MKFLLIMNKHVANQIADEKLKEIMAGDKSRIMALLKESEHEFVERHGVEYQIRIEAFYDDKRKKIIRVCISIDDQRFWSTLLPLSRSELISE